MVDWVLDSGADAVFDPEFGLGAFRAAIDDRIGIRSLEENGELPEWMEAVSTLLKCEE